MCVCLSSTPTEVYNTFPGIGLATLRHFLTSSHKSEREEEEEAAAAAAAGVFSLPHPSSSSSSFAPLLHLYTLLPKSSSAHSTSNLLRQHAEHNPTSSVLYSITRGFSWPPRHGDTLPHLPYVTSRHSNTEDADLKPSEEDNRYPHFLSHLTSPPTTLQLYCLSLLTTLSHPLPHAARCTLPSPATRHDDNTQHTSTSLRLYHPQHHYHKHLPNPIHQGLDGNNPTAKNTEGRNGNQIQRRGETGREASCIGVPVRTDTH